LEILFVKFLGIDFGWQTGPSGLAALEWDGVQLASVEMVCHQPFEDILAWVDRVAGDGPALVAVDAPTIIPNETGMRLPDKLTHSYFGKYHAGCYPANLQLPFAERTVALGRALEARKFNHANTIEPLHPGRYQIECFPHPAIVHLFDLSRILKYKKGPLAERRLELERYRSLILKELTLHTPKLSLSSLPPIPRKGVEMKALEDQLDALLCAYVGAYWWYWGVARNQVLGNRHEGYIVVPHRIVKDV
jgi:predicted RNase H-like nuclease